MVTNRVQMNRRANGGEVFSAKTRLCSSDVVCLVQLTCFVTVAKRNSLEAWECCRLESIFEKVSIWVKKVQNKNYAPGDVVPRPIDIWGNSTMGWCRRTHESARRAGNQ